MQRIAVRLSVFFVALSIFAVLTPSDAQAQMCVRYARMLTGFNIQGDAWSWWDNAVGRYQRGIRPAVGSVLVFRRTDRLQYGHVSTVSRIIDRRTILVDHSWLEGDVLHRGMKVVDTSSANNWSSVRVWYEPSDNLGLRTYPTFGFVYPHGGRGLDEPLTVAANDVGTDQNAVLMRGPRTRVAALPVTPVFLPHHKPATVVAMVTPAARIEAIDAGMVLAYAPRRKPEGAAPAVAAATAPARAVEITEVPQVVVPRHKPGSRSTSQVAELHGHGLPETTAAEIGD